MQISGRTTRRAMAVVGVMVAGLVTGAPAQASDASLRKAIIKQEKRIEPEAMRFTKAVKDPYSAVGIEEFTAALADLRAGVRSYKKAVVKEKATSAKVKRGRTQFVAALSDASKALTTYREGLQLVLDEEPAKAKTTFARAAAQLKTATRKGNAAEELIGVDA